MRNRHELAKLAERHGVALRKQLKTFVDGKLVVLEVDRPAREVAAELRELGAIE